MKTLLPIIICLLLLPGTASAVKFYKWVDADGKVTYQENPPPANASKVEEKNINPDQNVIQADQPAADAPTSSRRGSSGSAQQGSDESADPDAKTVISVPVLQEGSEPEVSGANPLPAPELPPAVSAPSAVAPPPALAPPPVVPPPPALPPPPPGGAR